MELVETGMNGVFVLDLFHAKDHRGVFVKPFHRATFEKFGLDSRFDESFYSTNVKGVLRGMHFQLPPEDHSKLIYCTSGKLLDVVLDIRTSSPTFGQAISVELSGDNFRAIYIPKGCAHGFAVLEDNTTMIYLTSTMHHPPSDSGIRWDSFDFEWPFDEPIISPRDLTFPALSDFKSPF